MHVSMLHKIQFLVKSGHILQKKCLLVFPLMLDDSSACLQPFILASCHSPLLQLQLRSAGSLHVAFRNFMNHRVEAEQS